MGHKPADSGFVAIGLPSAEKTVDRGLLENPFCHEVQLSAGSKRDRTGSPTFSLSWSVSLLTAALSEALPHDTRSVAPAGTPGDRAHTELGWPGVLGR